VDSVRVTYTRGVTVLLIYHSRITEALTPDSLNSKVQYEGTALVSIIKNGLANMKREHLP